MGERPRRGLWSLLLCASLLTVSCDTSVSLDEGEREIVEAWEAVGARLTQDQGATDAECKAQAKDLLALRDAHKGVFDASRKDDHEAALKNPTARLRMASALAPLHASPIKCKNHEEVRDAINAIFSPLR